MAKDFNKQTLTGRLGADPEMKATPTGKFVTTFRVASNSSTKRDGQVEEETEWFSIVAWEKLGEICNEYLKKGSRVLIEGKTKTRSWVDTATGETKYRTEVIASDMVMLDSAPSTDRAPAPSRPAAPAQRPARPGTRPQPIVDDPDLPF